MTSLIDPQIQPDLPGEYRAIAISSPGGPEVLQLVTEQLLAPQAGEVLIRVAAAGVNGPDISQRRGQYDPPPGASPLPGLEVSGTIVALGAEVNGHMLGEDVMALTNGGGYAEYVSVPAGQVLPVPLDWSLAEAAALPETLFTITQQLVLRAGLEAGMHVLVHGAAGGIGGAAILVSRALGAHPIGVVSSDEKADYARLLGAVATIDRTREDIVARTMEITGGHGADRVVDIVGGSTARLNIAASARFGHILLVSTLAGTDAEIPLRQIMAKQLTVSGSTLRPQTTETKAAIAETIRLRLFDSLIAADSPRPRVASFGLEQAADAHRAFEAPDQYGKIVLLTDHGRERSG